MRVDATATGHHTRRPEVQCAAHLRLVRSHPVVSRWERYVLRQAASLCRRPGTRRPEGMYRGGRRQDATRLDTCSLQLICLATLRVVVIYHDTYRWEEIYLDTLRVDGKCPGTRRQDAKYRGTPRPNGHHMPCHSSLGKERLPFDTHRVEG
jgi:hypothetical protein